MTQLHGARSGHLVRTRRRHRLPAGPRELGLHRDHGLEHGREPPGGLPVGDGGRERGAQVFHVDPRFTRTSAMATSYVGIRAGSDIAFLGGIVNYILEHERWFDEYVKRYTNAPVIIDEELRGHRGSRRALLRLGREQGKYDIDTWRYAGTQSMAPPASASGDSRRSKGEQSGHGGHGGAHVEHGEPPEGRRRSQHPRCVFQILRRHYARYTPEFVADACGCTVEEFLARRRDALRELGPRADRLVRLRGRLDPAHDGRPDDPHRGDHPAAAREHRPARRRHHRAARPRVDPGLDRHPDALQHPSRLPDDAAHGALRRPRAYIDRTTAPGGWWGQARRLHRLAAEGVVGRSGDARERLLLLATCRASTSDNSHYWTVEQMLQGKVRGYIVVGQNPAVGSANGKAHRLAPREARLARRARPRRDRDRGLLVRQPRESSRAS